MLPIFFALDPIPPEMPTPSAHHTLESRPSVRTFRSRWGDWIFRWDGRNRTPREAFGPPVDFEHMPHLVDDLARLAGVDPSALRQQATVVDGPRSATRWQLIAHGLPVQDAWIDVFTMHGRIHYVRMALHRVGHLRTPVGTDRIAITLEHDRYRYTAVRTERHEDMWVLRDREGRALRRYTSTLDLDLVGLQRDPSTPEVAVPARYLTVTDASGSEVTEASGLHARTAPFDVALTGPALVAIDDVGAVLDATAVTDGVLDDEFDLGTRTVALHVLESRDWLEDRASGHPWLASPTVVSPNQFPGTCIAQFASGQLNFSDGNASFCAPPNQHGDIIRHEFGHGIHVAGLLGGGFGVDISEGSADYFAATQMNDPTIGRDYYATGDPLRELDPDRVYPDDFTGMVHNDGRIWSSMFWNLRTEWESSRPDGAAEVDRLLIDALRYGPTFPDVSGPVLLANDDDGDLSNGTPDDCDLLDRLEAHGIGTGGVGWVQFDHQPLGPQPSGASVYPVSFELFTATPDCSTFDPTSARVHWRSGADEGEEMPVITGLQQTAALPAVPVGAVVEYWLTWTGATGEVRVPETGTFAFQVGDTTPLFCDDFEGGWSWEHGPGRPGEPADPSWFSQWEVGTPTSGFPSPASAHSGTQSIATALNAPYADNNAQYTLMPALDLNVEGVHTVLRLEARRFASFERGLYDQARITRLPDTVLWENPADQDVFDGAWVPFDVDLRDVGGSNAQLMFSLDSDNGVGFGGWHLDDVCVVVLDDAAGHYTVSDLTASDDSGPVTVSWTNPFVLPLVETILVRNHTIPTGPFDGEVLEIDTSPEPGAPRTLVVDNEGPQIYAVFARDAADHVFELALLGSNADQGGSEPLDTGETGETGETGDTGATTDTADDTAETGTSVDSGSETGLIVSTADTGDSANTADTAESDADTDTDTDTDTDADADTDSDADADTDSDADADTDTDTDADTDTESSDKRCGCAQAGPTWGGLARRR